jgi:DnaK suppressor protein
MHPHHGGLIVARPRLGGGLVTEFRRLLGEARGRLLRTVAVTDDELQGLSAPEQEFSEEAARRAAAQLLAGFEDRERREIDEIEAATARLATGDFGLCESCGAAVPLSRLRAVPWARHCLSCQKREERRP